MSLRTVKEINIYQYLKYLKCDLHNSIEYKFTK